MALLGALGLGAWGLGAAAAPPKVCGECGTCPKKRCRNDDGCFYDAAARTCQDVGADPCRGIQKKHGRKAPPEVGGPGGKKKRCVATQVPVGGSASPCVCQKKDGTPSPMNRKGLPRTCRLCSMPAPPGEDLEGDGGGEGGDLDSGDGGGGRGVGVPFPDRDALYWAVVICLSDDPTGANCQHDGIPIGDWDVSQVTDMNGLFATAHEFNADISNWNTSAVTNMKSMFMSAWAFNQDISSWNSAAVTNMNGMFEDASAFNQDISSWDVMAVTDYANLDMWTGATSMTDEAHKPCTATGFGADGKTRWRKC